MVLSPSLSLFPKAQRLDVFLAISQWKGQAIHKISYAVKDKAWVNTQGLLDWVICVGAPYAGCFFDDGTYLLIKEFSVHMKSDCVNAIKAQGTKVDFVAGGYTGVLQKLDKGINKPFKQHIWDAALLGQLQIMIQQNQQQLTWIEQA